MQRGRLLIVIALLLLLLISAAAVVAVFFLQGQGSAGGTDTPPGGTETAQIIEVTPTAESILILAAAQNLNRGDVIPTEAVIAIPWPTHMAPPSAITDPAVIVGSRARYTIARGEPIFNTMIVESLAQISPFGSDAAAQIPPGFVAISIPYNRRDGVALGVKDGDYVNVIVSWALVDLDEEFQSVLPNLTAAIAPPESSFTSDQTSTSITGMLTGLVVGSGPERHATGRAESDPVLNIPLYLVPQEAQRARLVTQGIIQNALVLRVGNFTDEKPLVIEPTATALPPEQQTPTAPPPPTPTPVPPDIITLVVSPQDALVLDYIRRQMQYYPHGVNITLVLRSAGDTTLAETESVTLQYMFDRFGITLPAKLAFGLDRAIPPAEATPAP